MQKMYSEQTARNWDYFFEQAETDFDIANYIALLNRHNIKPPCRTLDIGCGTGRFAIALNNAGYDVVGIDTCESMINVFREKIENSSPMEIVHTDFDKYETKEKFAGIVALYVMQFLLEVDQVVGFFKKVHSLLDDKGVFMFAVYNTLGIWNPSGWSAAFTCGMEKGFRRIEVKFTPVEIEKGICSTSDYRVLCLDDEYSIDYYAKMIRLYTLEEYIMMLELAGFRNANFTVDQNSVPSDAIVDGMKLYISATK